MRAEFDETLVTGNELIDSQHQELISRIKQFVDSCEDGGGKIKAIQMLDYLADYTNFHFSAEEKLQKDVGYPGLAEHQKKHEEFKNNLKELEAFLAYREKEHPDVAYIMEEFVRAEVNSYDAIIDAHGNPIFEAGNVSPVSIMDIVNNDDNSIYYIIKDLPEDTRAAGRAAVKSFGVKSRFVHFEFFRLTRDQE